eukprot:12320-Heterococcus_DN1.PRE.5
MSAAFLSLSRMRLAVQCGLLSSQDDAAQLQPNSPQYRLSVQCGLPLDDLVQTAIHCWLAL